MNIYNIRKKAGSFGFNLFFVLLLIGLIYIFIFPLLTIIITAISSPESSVDPTVLWVPKKVSAVGIKTAMELMNFLPSLGLTAEISVLATLASCIACSLAGYGLARFKFPGKNLIFAFVVLTIVVPPIFLTNPSFVSFRYFDPLNIFSLTEPVTGFSSINLLDTVWTFVFPAILGVGLRGGLFIFIFRQSFLGMPKDLEEAAKIDGCGAFKTYVRIIVPLAVPTFVTVILFSFIWHWNDFYYSAAYFMNDTRPLTVELSAIAETMYSSGMTGSIMGTSGTVTAYRTYIMAGCLLTIFVPLVLYLFLQRFFIESVERTGIVG